MNDVSDTTEYDEKPQSRVTATPYGKFIVEQSMWLSLLLGPVAFLNLALLYLVAGP